MLDTEIKVGRVMPFHSMFSGQYYLQLKWTSELLLEPTLTSFECCLLTIMLHKTNYFGRKRHAIFKK